MAKKPIGNFDMNCDVITYTIQYPQPKYPKKDDEHGSKYDKIITSSLINELQKELNALKAERDAPLIKRMNQLRTKSETNNISAKERKELLDLLSEQQMRGLATAQEETKVTFAEIAKTQLAMLKMLEREIKNKEKNKSRCD